MSLRKSKPSPTRNESCSLSSERLLFFDLDQFWASSWGAGGNPTVRRWSYRNAAWRAIEVWPPAPSAFLAYPLFDPVATRSRTSWPVRVVPKAEIAAGPMMSRSAQMALG